MLGIKQLLDIILSHQFPHGSCTKTVVNVYKHIARFYIVIIFPMSIRIGFADINVPSFRLKGVGYFPFYCIGTTIGINPDVFAVEAERIQFALLLIFDLGRVVGIVCHIVRQISITFIESQYPGKH